MVGKMCNECLVRLSECGQVVSGPYRPSSLVQHPHAPSTDTRLLIHQQQVTNPHSPRFTPELTRVPSLCVCCCCRHSIPRSLPIPPHLASLPLLTTTTTKGHHVQPVQSEATRRIRTPNPCTRSCTLSAVLTSAPSIFFPLVAHAHALQVLGVGKRKIYLDPSHLSEIANANSRQK